MKLDILILAQSVAGSPTELPVENLVWTEKSTNFRLITAQTTYMVE